MPSDKIVFTDDCFIGDDNSRDHINSFPASSLSMPKGDTIFTGSFQQSTKTVKVFKTWTV